MTPHLFEFMDHPGTPAALRATLLETLECCNHEFRPYYQEIADELIPLTRRHGITRIVEAGAGSAPLTKELVRRDDTAHLTLTPSDLTPAPADYRELSEAHPDRVEPFFEPCDLTEQRDWPDGTAIVLVATLHHIPHRIRAELLHSLSRSADAVFSFEPVRKTPLSMALVLLAVFPAVLMPFYRWRRPGRIRRALLCWLFPIVPLMFVWDGLISCLRQWNAPDWRRFAETVPPDSPQPQIVSGHHSQVMVWTGLREEGRCENGLRENRGARTMGARPS